MFILIIFFYLFIFIKGQNFIDGEFKDDHRIQKRMIDLQINATNPATATVVFKNAMLTSPLQQYIFYAISGIEYNQWSTSCPNQLRIVFQIQPPINVNQNSLTINVTNNMGNLLSMKISILVFSNLIPYLGYIVGSKTTGISQNVPIPIPSTEIVNLIFTTGMNLITNTHGYRFEYYSDCQYLSGTYDYRIFYTNSVPQNFQSISLLVLSYNKNILKNTYHVLTFNSYYVYGTIQGKYNDVIDYNNYGLKKAKFIVGLNRVDYFTATGNTHQFIFSIRLFPDDNNLQYYLTDKFNYITFGIAIFYSFECSNPLYPFKIINASVANGFFCYDQCPSKQYQIYNISSGQYQCKPCTTANCLECKNDYCIKCYSNYTLKQQATNSSCILKDGLFLNGTTVDLCTNQIANCSICSMKYLTFLPMNVTLLCLNCLNCELGNYIKFLGVVDTKPYQCFSCHSLFNNCKMCDSSYCFQCNQPYILINSTKCQQNQPNNTTLNCTDLIHCKICNSTDHNWCFQCKTWDYFVINGICRQKICGDSNLDPLQECQDGNTINFDGCSERCKVEHGFQCIPSALMISDCQFIQPINMKVLSVNKYVNMNKIKINLKISQIFIRQWSQFSQQLLHYIFEFKIPKFQLSNSKTKYQFHHKAKFLSSSNIPQKSLQKRYLQSVNNGASYLNFNPFNYEYIQLQISYNKIFDGKTINNQSLNHQQAIISLIPNLSYRNVFKKAPSTNITFSLTTDQNQLIQEYDFQYHQKCQIFFILGLIISIVVWLQIILSFFVYFIEKRNSRSILIALENAFIVQFTYYSISGIGQLNPLFISLASGLKYSAGFDILLNNEEFLSNRVLNGIGIQSQNISSNFNISFIILFLTFISGCILLIINKFKQKKENSQQQSPQKADNNNHQSFKKIFELIFGNFSFSLLLFFLYKIFISIFIQFKYSQTLQILDIVILSLSIIILVTYLFIIVKKSQILNIFTQKIYYLSQNDKQKLKRIFNKQQNKNQQKKKKNKNNQNKDQEDKDRKLKQDQEFLWKYKVNIHIKKVYPLFIIFSHFINSLICIYFGFQSKDWNICVIILDILIIVLSKIFNIYNPSNTFRIFLINLLQIFIQLFLIIRHFNISQVSQIIGGQQSNFGLYLATTQTLSQLLILHIQLKEYDV